MENIFPKNPDFGYKHPGGARVPLSSLDVPAGVQLPPRMPLLCRELGPASLPAQLFSKGEIGF